MYLHKRTDGQSKRFAINVNTSIIDKYDSMLKVRIFNDPIRVYG